MRRPNFLVVMTDQQRADHLGCYGNAVVRTPAIDALARGGWQFDRAYVAAPVCMANRASFMTSRMPSLHGVRHNGIPLSRGAPTFVEMLRADGYETALVGKCHLQNMEDRPPRLALAPRDGRRVLDGFAEARRENLREFAYRQELPSTWRDPAHRIAAPYYGFAQVELADDHGDLAFGDYDRWLTARDGKAAARRGRDGAIDTPGIVAPQAWRTSLPAELYPSAYVGARAVAFLERVAAGDRPFFLMCSFPDPHHPFTPPGRYWDMYDPARIDLPASFATGGRDLSARLAWLHAERAAGDAPVDSHRVFAVEEAEARQATALTYGMISLIDDALGRILEALEAHAMRDDTVIVFTSDHGDFMGDHGLLLKGPLHYQSLIRVPLIWSDPTLASSGRSEALVSTLDIGETILHRAGLAAPNGTQGTSLLDLMAGRPTPTRDAVLIEDETQRAYLGFSRPIRLRTLVTREHRISLYGEDGVGELYDLAEDPHELTDLWHDPASQATRATLVDRLAREMLDLADRSPLPTGLA